MARVLPVAFVDTAAGDLTFSLRRPRLPAVHSTVAEIPAAPTGAPAGEVRVELNVLGCSHQVIVSAADSEVLIETLACLPGEPAHLPESASGTVAGGEHEFGSRVEHVPASRFPAAVEALTTAARRLPHHAVVRFPGHAGAVTALALDAGSGDALRWRTWHCYPQTGEIVHTWSALRGSWARRAPAPVHRCEVPA